MLMRRYEMPWRRAYELYAGAVWALAHSGKSSPSQDWS